MADAALTLVPTTAQRSAIEAPLGPLLVLAGPGAGKTFCLIERIRHLIREKGIDPSRIVAVTFTNKAAGEIAYRLRDQLGPAADQVTRSTIHALCVQLLREFGSTIQVPDGFGIADEEYQHQVLRRINYRFDKGWVLRLFSLYLIQGESLDDFIGRLYQSYRERLDRHRLLDFDDLVVRTEQLLRTQEAVAREVASRWDYVLVDEGQDLNPKQYAILKRMAEPHNNIFVVGDDEQSIYSWAGADPAVLRTFLNDYGLTRRVLLDENRRNSRQIFETARRLVAHNPKQHEKTALRATREGNWPVLVRGFADEDEEARWLIKDLTEDQASSGLPWGEYALLYRRHDIGEALEGRLIEAGIPCRLAQGRALADDRAVQYLVAALRVIDRPGDPLLEEQFARVVLPRTLLDGLRAEAEQHNTDVMVWLRRFGQQSRHRDEDGRKVRRCLWALANLPAIADRHEHLEDLVGELLSQRVGEYRTILEEHADVISDPAATERAPRLAALLRRARRDELTVWLPGMGGAEFGLAGLLREAGITKVGFLGVGKAMRPEEVVLGAPGAPLRPLDVFKGLQLASSDTGVGAFRDFVAVDVESTDNDVAHCEVIEIGAVRVRAGEIVGEFRRLVKPIGRISERASEIHGYRTEDVADAPAFAQVWTEFREFAGDDLLVAHNGHGFDFPVLRRLADGHPAGNEFVAYDTLPLARDLHQGSRSLGDLARTFGIDTGRGHHALDDSRTLAQVFLKLESEKRARARKTSLVSLIDHLAVALALVDPAELDEESRMFLDLGKLFALGRYSQALASYAVERTLSGSEAAPTLEQLIERLGGPALMERLQREKRAEDRYPSAMLRLRRLLDGVQGTILREQLAQFLDRVALSQSRGGPEIGRDRVNLLTLHSTKGLEFSRVYVVGVEDAQLPGGSATREASRHELEEARRLLYVGMTRAKDRLVLTHVRSRGGRDTVGVRYLEEMDLA